MTQPKAGDRMLRWFEFEPFPDDLREVSRPFYALAKDIENSIQAGPERTVAFRKLLEAKDAAVRAVTHPGG